jgi:hypothetical protein
MGWRRALALNMKGTRDQLGDAIDYRRGNLVYIIALNFV